MKLDISFIQQELEALVQKMGAKPIPWSSGSDRLESPGFAEKLRKGIEIPLGVVRPDPNTGVLIYSNEVVLLYIMDTHNDRNTLLNGPENAKRFHVADCQTLKKMRAEGRAERYVVTNNTSGEFNVVALDRQTNKREKIKAELKVCKQCLSHLNYKSYKTNISEKGKIWRNFSIAEFLEKYQPHFIHRPKHTDETAPIQGYTTDWPEISKKYRELRQWYCEECWVNLSSDKNLLHCHHLNGQTADNSNNNLKSLCKLCHSKVSGHNMFISTKDKNKIYQMRNKERNLFNLEDA